MDRKREVGDNVLSLFDQAATYVESVTFDVSVSDRLYFYSRYKQATEGPCNIPKPSLFNLQGKKKWEAWNELKHLNKREAMKQYIMKLSEIDPCWESASPIKTAWVSVSTMMKEEPTVADSEKNVFDFVQENDLEKVKLLPAEELNKLDENEMSPLHWACDRGYLDLVEHLLARNFRNLNIQDNEGQTPLHYAASCGHEAVVKLLLEHEADVNVKDNDGMCPVDCVQEETVRVLFK